MRIKNLHKAKVVKDDEFYTQYNDIEKELKHYWKYLKGKTIYMPCDDYTKSKFVLYFINNFKAIGLKKIIATYYKCTQLSIFEPSVQKSKYFEMTANTRMVRPVAEDGDFRSNESIRLIKKSDVIITNPPFSLALNFFTILMKYQKEMILLNSLLSVKKHKIFRAIQNNKLKAVFTKKPLAFNRPDGSSKAIPVVWLTNLNRKLKVPALKLKQSYNINDYRKFYNYDCIHVTKVKDIPDNYYELMAVPITYLKFHNRNKFQLIGVTESSFGRSIGIRDCKKAHNEWYKVNVNNRGLCNGDSYFVLEDGTIECPFTSIVIKRIK